MVSFRSMAKALRGIKEMNDLNEGQVKSLRRELEAIKKENRINGKEAARLKVANEWKDSKNIVLSKEIEQLKEDLKWALRAMMCYETDESIEKTNELLRKYGWDTWNHKGE